MVGSGWVSGGDNGPSTLLTGYGAVFAARERCLAGSDPGMTAVLIAGLLELRPMWVTQDIAVVDYDTAWPEHFEVVRSFVWPAVAGIALGSNTSGRRRCLALRPSRSSMPMSWSPLPSRCARS